MTTLFILFSSGLYILLMLPKGKRRKCYFNLGIGTLTPFYSRQACCFPLISIWLHLPGCQAQAGCFRFLALIWTCSAFLISISFLCCWEPSFYCSSFRYAYKGKRFKKQKAFFFTLIAMMVIPIFLKVSICSGTAALMRASPSVLALW